MTENSQIYVPRTCKEVVHDKNTTCNEQNLITGKTLSEFSDKGAYVLLGDPGAGKTECFKNEAQHADCLYIKAREFICFDIEDSWKKKTLFIDGLDEIRVGEVNGLMPLDALRKQLRKLRCPSFRISCREADWLGSSDRQDLEKVAPANKITCLHLELLDEKSIRKIIQNVAPSVNVQKFLEWADVQDLMPLLGNPQILILMVKAVSGGAWPKTRTQAYEFACREIVSELNERHQQADKKNIYAIDQILNTGGMLFAHQLISGIEGYSLFRDGADVQHPFYQQVFSDDISRFEVPFKTNLFRLGTSDKQREPIHRSIAEFLAAKYLTDLVEQKGLPIGRVLSMLTAADGGVVTPLRGLFAWFVTLCRKDRDIIITRDPLGIVLFGDVTSFPVEQKQALLIALFAEAEKYYGFRSENWIASPFGALATSDMEDVFRSIIESPSRDEAEQVLVGCVMDAMLYGIVYPGLEKLLWNLVKDHRRWSAIRGTGLKILFRNNADDPVQNEIFLRLLNDLNRGIVEDRDDELLGMLLKHLYPRLLSAKHVLDYFHYPKNDRLIGVYCFFWRHDLVELSNEKMIAELLDQLCNRKELKELMHNSTQFNDLLRELLVGGLSYCGDNISDSRLYDWLGVGLDKYGTSIVEPVSEAKQTITVRQWISDRPHRYKAILQEGAKRFGCEKKESTSIDNINSWLFNAEAPADMDRWYLSQAAAYKTGDVAEYYFRQAVFTLESGVASSDFTLDDIYDWLSDNSQFKEMLENMLIDISVDQRIERATKKNKHNRMVQQKKAEWIAQIVKHKEEISQGSAPPAILHDIANAYYGFLIGAKGDTPHKRLKSMFPGRDDLYEAALQGLVNSKNRVDLPSVKEIITAATIGSPYYLTYAVLAGLDEICIHNPDGLSLITTQQYEHALAFYFTAAPNDMPDWVKMIVECDSDLVSKVFIQYATICLKSKKEYVSGIYQLAYDELWKGVAVQSAIPILEKYPVRAKATQINNLDYLIKAALKFDNNRLAVLVDKKLQFKSMDTIQRGRWLATGLLLSPENFEKLVLKFMENNSVRRISAIASFLSIKPGHWWPDCELPISTIGMLIQKLGSYFRPYDYSRSGYVTREMNVADLVSGFINNLSSSENTDAANELEHLLSLPELKKWSDFLRRALYRQRKITRDVSFQVPDINQVRQTLSNAEPSNSADLMALTLNLLNDIASRIRNGSTNDHKQYWNTDSYNKPVSPKVEDACRDALLSDLQQQLAPLKIDAIKEGYYANEKRADIKVSYNGTHGFNVPIEIKRDVHENLWTALRKQLIRYYTRDPGTQGYGIYIVFWFGVDKVSRPSHGKRPKSATEMKNMLWDTMSRDEKRLIGVCVIDCSD